MCQERQREIIFKKTYVFPHNRNTNRHSAGIRYVHRSENVEGYTHIILKQAVQH